MSRKKPLGTPSEVAVERFRQSLALGKPDSALRVVEAFFKRHPNESDVPFFIALKHFVGFRTAEFKERLKKASNKCEPDCKGRILSEERGVYCECISNLLPEASKQSVETERWEDIDQASGLVLAEPRIARVEEELIVAKLEECGCDKQEVSLVMDKIFEKMTLKQVVEKHSLSSTGAADHKLRMIFAKLRKAGFSLEGTDDI